MTQSKEKKFVLWFKELRNTDVKYVGGKNASLGEMYHYLTPKGVLIPNGFAVTAAAYQHFLKEAGIKKEIRDIIKETKIHNLRSLMTGGKKIRETILNSDLPTDLEKLIIESYRQLEKEYGKNCDVAVRSSATAEDLPDASFAGQQDTYLNIRGAKQLLIASKKCVASLFTNRAISYREDKGFDHFKVSLSIGVQKMVRSDKAASGVMFTIDTESGFDKVVLINSSYGLGENIVQGKVTPDEYYVFKPTLAKGYKAILARKLGKKNIKMIYSNNPAKPTIDIPVKPEEQLEYSITDNEVLQLSKWGVIIEDHYKRAYDIEWAKDGLTGKLYIVQARPETVQSQRDYSVLEDYQLSKRGKVLSDGSPVGSKIGSGKANVINDVKDIHKFKKGEVLVTDMTDPDWEPIMKIAAAIVTNRGGRTCHAAIVSRELGIPCLVGTEDATKKIKTGRPVTVSCGEGETGYVYDGLIKYNVKRTSIKNLKRPKTKMMMNLGDPEQAFDYSFIPNDGVGLAREEFIINSYIQIHPRALLNYGRLKDKNAKKKIDQLTKGYKSKRQFFIDRLASGIAIIGAAFYPNDVIVRLSDFKTNEYANLIGGKQFEPEEDNPMIGWRGASRYYDDNFRKAFALECLALKKVRDEIGLKNVKVMVPFCRTVEEGKKVLAEMAKNGLKRGVDGLEIYVMCEIPSNVILADEFSKHFDGFSIGSNDLTQLTLGLDRDSELVSHIYDERNPAVKKLVSEVIKKAKANKRKIGICGQAPSDYPEFARFIVAEGIDSMSLNPDTVIKTTLDILALEKKLNKKKSKKRKTKKKERNK
ncbi:phosphoenolpyruvate synthase [Patescibacteria group bacterium]|nr:phosphoenolpyruvate synthase [Patescibacteria group bacterium]MBU1890213.1 phosphoenolpyruvate synthase [Patescibacteria group bacterium]